MLVLKHDIGGAWANDGFGLTDTFEAILIAYDAVRHLLVWALLLPVWSISGNLSSSRWIHFDRLDRNRTIHRRFIKLFQVNLRGRELDHLGPVLTRGLVWSILLVDLCLSDSLGDPARSLLDRLWLPMQNDRGLRGVLCLSWTCSLIMGLIYMLYLTFFYYNLVLLKRVFHSPAIFEIHLIRWLHVISESRFTIPFTYHAADLIFRNLNRRECLILLITCDETFRAISRAIISVSNPLGVYLLSLGNVDQIFAHLPSFWLDSPLTRI